MEKGLGRLMEASRNVRDQALMHAHYILKLLPVSEWPIKMIGQSVLLLVVSYLFAVLILILWVRVEKVNN